MIAVYPEGGTRFQRHVDNTAGDGRRLTVVLYLNDDDWSEKDGGCLRIWGRPDDAPRTLEGNSASSSASSSESSPSVSSSSTSAPPVDFMPIGGRLAMFFSDQVAHEVLANHRKRLALTIWYYDALERSEAVASAMEAEKNAGGTGEEKNDKKAAMEASAFIKDTIAGKGTKGEGEGREDVTDEELKRVGEMAAKLSERAVKIVAGICGAKDEETFRAGCRNLTREGLRELRAGMNTMGI